MVASHSNTLFELSPYKHAQPETRSLASPFQNHCRPSQRNQFTVVFDRPWYWQSGYDWTQGAWQLKADSKGLISFQYALLKQSPLQWYAVPVEGKKDHYNVVQDPDLTHPPGLALVKGSNKVIVSLQPDEWRLEYQPVEIANGNVYKSVPLSNFTYMLGTNFLHKTSSPFFWDYWSIPSSWEGAWWKRGEAAFHINTERCLNDFCVGCDSGVCCNSGEPGPGLAILRDGNLTEAFCNPIQVTCFRVLYL